MLENQQTILNRARYQDNDELVFKVQKPFKANSQTKSKSIDIQADSSTFLNERLEGENSHDTFSNCLLNNNSLFRFVFEPLSQIAIEANNLELLLKKQPYFIKTKHSALA